MINLELYYIPIGESLFKYERIYQYLTLQTFFESKAFLHELLCDRVNDFFHYCCPHRHCHLHQKNSQIFILVDDEL